MKLLVIADDDLFAKTPTSERADVLISCGGCTWRSPRGPRVVSPPLGPGRQCGVSDLSVRASSSLGWPSCQDGEIGTPARLRFPEFVDFKAFLFVSKDNRLSIDGLPILFVSR